MVSINYKETGVVFNIQRFSINDGPGIRTIVFLKGCPLSCYWCSNPESQNREAEVMYDESTCIKCGKCAKICKYDAINKNNPGLVNREKCVGCGDCADICPTGSLVLKGEVMTVEEVITILKKDTIIYRESGGGITLSGGEPLVQWKFATELLKACKAQGWHTAMETTGYGSEDAVESVFKYLDLALLDCKSTFEDIHKKYVGSGLDLIHKNARRISEITDVTIRVPTIPNVNANKEEFERICDYAKSLNGVDTIHILPYHVYGENKYGLLDRDYRMNDIAKPLKKEDASKFKDIVESNGLKCQIGG